MAVLGVSFPVIFVLLVCIARGDVFDYSLSTCLPSSNILCNIITRVGKEYFSTVS